MAKRPKDVDESRHGKMAAGWVGQGLQIPASFGKAFKAEATAWGPNSVKVLGSVATGLLLGMPKHVREQMYLWMVRASRSPHDLDPDHVWSAFQKFMAESGEGGEEPEWYIDKIVDPELTPPPGKKASDRQNKNQPGAEDRAQGG